MGWNLRPKAPPLLVALALLGACSNGPGGETPAGTGGQGNGGTSAGGAATPTGGAPVSSGGLEAGGGGPASGGSLSGGAGGADLSSGGVSAGGSGGLVGTGGEIATSVDGSPLLLSQAGLYEADMVTLAEGVQPFEPRFMLWSDEATKKRWIRLPEGAQIDTSDMNYWTFPTGTLVFKEFSRDGVRVETRRMRKRDRGGWERMAYQWRSDQLEADARIDGVENASGTTHDIPTQEDCGNCHFRTPDKVLGFSAIQLAWQNPDPDAWTLDKLVAADKLTNPPPAIQLPGDATAQAALGYMHANCGHCHNPQSNVTTRVTVSFWLTTQSLGSVETTSTYTQTVCQPIELAEGAAPGASLIIDPGSPSTSAAFLRVDSRGQQYSMPDIATELIDPTGRDAIRTWIESLSTVSCP
jgi:hypothetical protein